MRTPPQRLPPDVRRAPCRHRCAPSRAHLCRLTGKPAPASRQTCASCAPRVHTPTAIWQTTGKHPAQPPTATPQAAQNDTPPPDGNKTQPQQETPRPARKQEQTQSPGKKPEKANRATPEPQKYPKSLRHPTPVTEKNSIFAPDTADLDRDLSHPSISTTPTKTTTN